MDVWVVFKNFGGSCQRVGCEKIVIPQPVCELSLWGQGIDSRVYGLREAFATVLNKQIKKTRFPEWNGVKACWGYQNNVGVTGQPN
jgi:hypothetical protein